LNKDEVERMVKEAEAHAAEDKEQRQVIEAKNQADQQVYQIEKSLKELGDKVPAADRSEVESALNRLREAAKGTDLQAIQSASDGLNQAFQKVSAQLYQQASRERSGGNGGPQAGPKAEPSGGEADESGQTVDADYKVVDDKKKK
jgi:molecular chaperone DnaK